MSSKDGDGSPLPEKQDDQPVQLDLDLSSLGFTEAKRVESSYKPNWTPGMGGAAGIANDHHQSIDDLINEFLRQQQAANMSIAKRKTPFAILHRWRKLILAGIGVIFAGIFIQYQYDEMKRKELEIARRGKLEMFGAADGANIAGIAMDEAQRRAMIGAKRKSAQSQVAAPLSEQEKFKLWIRTKFLKDRPSTMQIKAMPPLAGAKTIQEERAIWQNVLGCACEAVWNRHGSTNFRKLSKNFAMLVRGPYLFAFTPYFAGQERAVVPTMGELFSLRLKEIVGKKKKVPLQTNLVVANFNEMNGNIVTDYFYFTQDERGTLLFPPFTIPGKIHSSWATIDPYLKREKARSGKYPAYFDKLKAWPKTGTFRMSKMQSELWLGEQELRLDDTSMALLIKEIEIQALRYLKVQASVSDQQKRYASFLGATPMVEDQERLKQLGVMKKCRLAGQAVKNKNIVRVASREEVILQKLLVKKNLYRGNNTPKATAH